MWQPLSRVRAMAKRNRSRRFRWYKPESKHLEDRCLLSVVLIEKSANRPAGRFPGRLVGHGYRRRVDTSLSIQRRPDKRCVSSGSRFRASQ